MEQQNESIVKVSVKKSSINAENGFDYKKLSFKQSGLADCTIEEEKEELVFTYNVTGLKNMQEIRKEKKYKKLLVLLSAVELIALYREYFFSLSDKNLYYNKNGNIIVLQRDVYARGIEADEELFLMSIKALVGYAMQKRYSFEDYLDGGMDLMKKDKFLARIAKLSSLEDISVFLTQEYEKEENDSREKRIEVGKNWYKANRWYLIISFLVITGAVVYIMYASFILHPRTTGMLNADNAFMESDYVRVIDLLEQIDIKYLDKYKKYILAVSYVKGENLTPEQKENILSLLSINGDEKLKEYWIYLGRLNIEEAENIALQKSDDQLLLYSYLTKRSLLEKNTEISGEEKTAQLSALEKKIAELAKKYETEE